MHTSTFSTHAAVQQDQHSEYIDIVWQHTFRIVEFYLVLAGIEYSGAEPCSALTDDPQESAYLIDRLQSGTVTAISIDFELDNAQTNPSHPAPRLTAELSISTTKLVTIVSDELTWFHTPIESWSVRPVHLSP